MFSFESSFLSWGISALQKRKIESIVFPRQTTIEIGRGWIWDFYDSGVTQIVIPKEARDMFQIKAGDSVVVLCDKARGIDILKSDFIEDLADKTLKQ